jgi:hypothetical protein
MNNSNRINRLRRVDEIFDAVTPIATLTVALTMDAAHIIHLNDSCRRKKCANVKRTYRNPQK